MAEAELQGLGGELEAALQEVDLGHEEVGLCVGRVELQTVLQTALRGLHITCTSTTSPNSTPAEKAPGKSQTRAILTVA